MRQSASWPGVLDTPAIKLSSRIFAAVTDAGSGIALFLSQNPPKCTSLVLMQ
jgi:hypothetical protein